MAVVTFGGAYAVLAYMAQQAVETYHWLKPTRCWSGLGFAETTPGPLIRRRAVRWFHGGIPPSRNSVDPSLAGMIGGVLAKWATFVPSFIWIFMGAPYNRSVARKIGP